jgi:hypothetical protein
MWGPEVRKPFLIQVNSLLPIRYPISFLGIFSTVIDEQGAAQRPRQHSDDWCETEGKIGLDVINYCDPGFRTLRFHVTERGSLIRLASWG